MSSFDERLARCEEELKETYLGLYHDEKAYDYFVGMLRRCADERPQELRDLDEQRLADPGWYTGNDMLGMLMYVDCFAGTLEGVREKLGYIEECGVNYLHLMPLLESPEGRSDGGYAVSNFRKVQPELGTMDDLASLASECHRRNISVCLDFVMNHTSEDHAWAKAARAGDPEAQSRYFFYDNWDIPNEFEKTTPQVFPTTAPGNFSWCEEAGKVVMTTFYPYQWDLNYANPIVFNDMTEDCPFLCNQGIDVNTLVRLMHLACDIVCPGTLLLGEVVMEPSKVVPYFGSIERPECHLLYNVTTMASTWHTVATKDTRLLKHQLSQVFALPVQYTFLNYLRCHDDIGWGLDYDYLEQFGIEEVAHKKYVNDYFTGKWAGSPARGELYNDDPRLGDARLCGTTASLCGVEAARYERDDVKLDWALREDLMLHAYMFTISGIPVLYSGDEIAQENDYGYHDEPLKAADSRYLHRGHLNWSAAEKRTDPETPEGRVFQGLRTLETIRASHRVFDCKADQWLVDTHDDGVLGIGRYLDGEKLVALFNFSETEKTLAVDELGDFRDLLSGAPVDKNAVTLPPGGFIWMLAEL